MELFLFKVFIKIVGLRRCFSVHFLNCKLLHIKDQTLIVIIYLIISILKKKEKLPRQITTEKYVSVGIKKKV